MILALAIAISARAASTVDGSTGVVTVPTVETVPRSESSGAIGLAGVRDAAGGLLSSMPAGVSYGIRRRLEVGARIAPDGLRPVPGHDALATFGAHARYRWRDSQAGSAGLAGQVFAGSIRDDVSASTLAIGTFDRAGGLASASLGPRWSRDHGADLWAGLGGEVRVSAQSRALAEAAVGVGLSGLAEVGARGGYRWRLRDRLLGLAWAGVGAFERAPWLGAGVSLSFHTVDPSAADRDIDGLSDWVDGCRYEKEDPDGWEDEDGCPDPDNDGDGILDADDPTPDGEEAVRRRFVAPVPTLGMRIGTREEE